MPAKPRAPLPLHHPDRIGWRIAEYAQMTGLDVGTVYNQVYSGALPSVKIGGSRLIPRRVAVEAGLITE
ncbi:excisionase family DNA binding protein [Bradyrhizobium japonicum]|uniref:helix-turn-helix domain-containing protein n=1 Tax=Bradyrhizobium elkanii TaxID=29448 RepID=UPI00039A75DD|nr:helix-turn-helix domain-containing protein [Bradyrhizobium elkanii]MBP2434769.1 excisionase family DNA binding protein [Bradyrhizobium elkanii]MCP1731995.1 excisionase family DNA binding protein [Bradyrhizobium elkanii]MCS3567329.1 excisionase family DNA binding protein [Bradyrhizobium elkanii]MCS3591186.1 excisionase family DNA binding protein [Bradyrhizobium elkanii]MCS3620629.1 excisionase family DNA binding protein [Bradyrhizobium elkanii]